MNTKSKSRPFIGLLACWKRRKFYMVQDDTLDDESVPSDEKQPEPEPSPVKLKHPSEAYFKTQKASLLLAYNLRKSLSTDSFQDSIESMDSLVESYWDPGDDTSQATAIVSNTGQGNRRPDFLTEHMDFLSSQTQPREVEQVYKT
jgi:hypothetical protein